jgi:hypothetical protein
MGLRLKKLDGGVLLKNLARSRYLSKSNGESSLGQGGTEKTGKFKHVFYD